MIETLLMPPGGPTPADRARQDDAGGGFMTRQDMAEALPAYNARHGGFMAGRPVAGNHSKPCTECGASFHGMGEWYWTDAARPWGADKFCDDCMADKLGGVFDPDSEEG